MIIILILSIPRARGQQYSFYIWSKKPSRTQSKLIVIISPTRAHHLFIMYARLHVSASPGHHQGVTDYQRLQIKVRKYE
jgi:hypothetical protein